MARRWGCALAVMLTALVLAAGVLMNGSRDYTLPGSSVPERQLLRIWVTSAPGGGMNWLKKCLAVFEKQHPGMMTYVRQVTAADMEAPEALPDVVLHMAGDLSAPEMMFLPWTGEMPCDEALLRCGRWKGTQYGLPLCWGAWVLAIDSQWDVTAAVTPAPTTLLGKPRATENALPTATPGYPLEKIQKADNALMAPRGAGLFTLRQLLPEAQRPVMDAGFLKEEPTAVYQAFRGRQAASALLTTGQVTAFESLQRAGKGFPARMMVPENVITDQVWLAGICRESDAAKALMAFLLGEESQRRLVDQGLFGAQKARVLYTGGVWAAVEASARRSMTAINAYVHQADVEAAAWQAFFNRETMDEALLPLI